MSRPLFLFSMICVPLATMAFLPSLMSEGVANRIPAAVVDLDHTETSRAIMQNLGTLETVDIQHKLNSYSEAMQYMRRGEVFGFFVIPEGFSARAVAGRQPELTFYMNYAYFVPASLLMKGFTTMSVLANGSMIKTTLSTVGVPGGKIASALQPYVTDIHPLNNPWLDYGVYLSNSFVPGVLALMVMLVTVYTIMSEVKMKTSQEWLREAGGSILVALFSKLLPQTVIFTLVGWVIQVFFYGVLKYPMNGSMVNMLLAMFMLVVASQAFAVIVCSITPNLRLALSTCSLMGVLAFSICGYSFPVEDMYPSLGVFSYIIPMRYYFLIYVDQALNGLEFVYSRYYYLALLIFPLLSLPLLPRLKKACQNPVYVP